MTSSASEKETQDETKPMGSENLNKNHIRGTKTENGKVSEVEDEDDGIKDLETYVKFLSQPIYGISDDSDEEEPNDDSKDVHKFPKYDPHEVFKIVMESNVFDVNRMKELALVDLAGFLRDKSKEDLIKLFNLDQDNNDAATSGNTNRGKNGKKNGFKRTLKKSRADNTNVLVLGPDQPKLEIISDSYNHIIGKAIVTKVYINSIIH